eukprot:sb/3472918/
MLSGGGARPRLFDPISVLRSGRRCQRNYELGIKPYQLLFRVVMCLMVQLPIIQFILGVITISSWYNGDTASSYYGDTSSTKSIIASGGWGMSLILLVSFKFAIYAIHLQDATLSPYYVGRRFFKLKFYLFKALTILTKVQFSILGAVLEYGGDQPDSFG